MSVVDYDIEYTDYKISLPNKPHFTVDEINDIKNELDDEYQNIIDAIEEVKDELANVEDEEDIEELKEALEILESNKNHFKEIHEEFYQFCDDLEEYECGELIDENELKNYTINVIKDMANIKLTEWPFNHMDIDSAMEELKMDFTELEYDGRTFYCR